MNLMVSRSNSSRPLPDDIIIEILFRLPVKTLVRFCCVCKFWQNLITSNSFFIRCHLQNPLKSNKNINPSRVGNVLLNNGHDEYSDRSCICHEQLHLQIKKLTQKLEYYSDNSRSYRMIFRQGEFLLAGCCDGIICFVKDCFCCSCFTEDCSSCNIDPNLTLYLCNPALHQFRALPRSNYHTESNVYNTLVCFIFEHDDYKVVKIINCKISFMVEIYSLRNNAWKVFCSGIVSPRKILVPKGVKSEFVVHNGFPYWISRLFTYALILNVLDMNQEKIREIPLPDCFRTEEFPRGNPLHLFQFQGSLSIARKACTFPLIRDEVWVMKEDSSTGDISWTMKFVFPTIPSWLADLSLAPLSSRTTGLTATGKHLIVSSGGRIFLFDPVSSSTGDCIFLFDQENWPGVLENCSMMDLDVRSLAFQHVVADYVPSLVSIMIPSSSLDGKVQQIHSTGEKEDDFKIKRSYSSFLLRMLKFFKCKT